MWVRCRGRILTEADKIVLQQSGVWLNDRHINFAQYLLRCEFPDVEGLQNTLLQKKEKVNKIDTGVHILFDQGNHWVVALSLITSKGKELQSMILYFLKWTNINRMFVWFGVLYNYGQCPKAKRFI